jgi:hypothetical protein
MLVEVWTLLFLATLVFTILSIIYPQRFFLLIIPFILWNVLGLCAASLCYIGFGSLNPIKQCYEIGDPEHPEWQLWIFHGIGMIFLVYAVGTYFQMAALDLKRIGNHERLDTIIGRPER